MAISYKIDKSARTVLYRVDGRVGDRDIIELSRAAGEDPKYAGELNGLVDARAENIEIGVTADGVRELVEFNRKFPSDLNHQRVAIVASTDLGYGMSRMLQAYSEDLPGEYSVFRDMAEACAWLEIPATVCDAPEGWIDVG